MLVWGGERMASLLAGIFQQVWESGEVPPSWNVSQIKYLHKDPISSKTEITNYRPISLMSVVAKIFTRSWLPRLIRKIAPNLPLSTSLASQGKARADVARSESIGFINDLCDRLAAMLSTDPIGTAKPYLQRN